ncbi:MAG: hypothetical protein OHK0011_18930 [Turneriella sp.]
MDFHSLGRLALFVACLLTLSQPSAMENRSETIEPVGGEIEGKRERKLRLRRPIRLISRAEAPSAGNYREIPLADAPEAALSERASDVLQKQTGVQVNRVGAPGTQSLLGIRGASPDQVEYFIEGMPLPRPYNAPLNLETLPLPLFRTVDIYPSFIPAHLPATNLGGALDFRLRDITQRPEYLAQSSANSLLGSGLAVARLDHQSLNFVNLEQSRNRYPYRNNNGTTENTADDRTQIRTNEDFTRIGYTGFVRYQSSNWKLRALADVNHSERGLPGVDNMPLSAVRKNDTRAAAALAAEQTLGVSHRLMYFASLTMDQSEVSDPQAELFFARGQSSYSPQYMAAIGYALRSTEFEAALNTRGRYQSIFLNGSWLSERREAQLALVTAGDKRLIRIALQGNATFAEDRAEQNAFFASAARIIPQSGYGASGMLALRPFYFFRGSNAIADEKILELYGQVSSTYRPPSLYERFGDNIFVTPSQSLQSEQAVTNAAGMRTALPCPLRLTCSLRFEAFLTGARNYILFTQNSARTLIAVNASSARIAGAESELLFNLPERLLISLRYTYLDAQDYGNIPYYQGKYLPLRPRHHAVAVLTVFTGALRFIGSFEYRGAVFRDRYNSYFYYLASKTLVDLGLDYVLFRAARHTLNFTVKNILDDREPDVLGYTLPGRYALVKWTAEW